MTYLLDASVYEQPLLPAPSVPALARWQEIGFGETAISVLTEARVLSRLYVQGGETEFRYYQHTVRGQVRRLEVDLATARLFARLRARQHRSHLPVDEYRLLNVATAKIHGLVIATIDPEGYLPIAGALWEDWNTHAPEPSSAALA